MDYWENFMYKLNRRWVEWVHNMTVEKRSEFIEKCMTKYGSKEYNDKEYFKCGCFPRRDLFVLLYDYASEYCEDTIGTDEDFPIANRYFIIDGKYKVRILLFGQEVNVNIFRI